MPRGQHQPDRNVLQLQQESTREEDKLKRRTKSVEDEQAETQTYRGTETTNSATSKVLVKFEIFEGESFTIEARIEGESRDGADRGGYFLRGEVARVVGAGASIVAQVLEAHETAGAAAWNGNINVSGNDVRISFGDPGGATVDWHCTMTRKAKAPRVAAADIARSLV